MEIAGWGALSIPVNWDERVVVDVFFGLIKSAVVGIIWPI